MEGGGELWGVEDGWGHGTKLCSWVATLTAALSGCLGTWDPLSAWAATPLPAAPPPSPAVSFRSPNPFPHMWVTSKFREKAAWWLPKQRRGSVAPPSPPGGAPGREPRPPTSPARRPLPNPPRSF